MTAVKDDCDCQPVGITEIIERLDIARSTFEGWRSSGDFPLTPPWTVGGRPAWNWRDVKKWSEHSSKFIGDTAPRRGRRVDTRAVLEQRGWTITVDPDPTGLFIATGKSDTGRNASGTRWVDTEDGAIDWLYHAVIHGLTGSPDETPIVP